MYSFQRLFIILAVAVVGSLCSIPAWGGPVHRFTDKQGVIHIGNNGKPGPTGETESQEPDSGKVVNSPVNQETPRETPSKNPEVPVASSGQENSPAEPQGQAEKPPVPSGNQPPTEDSSVKGVQAVDPNSPEADPFLSPVRYVAPMRCHLGNIGG